MIIPPEAMAEIRKQCRINGHDPDTVDGIVFGEGFRAGRASIHTEWAASLAQDAQADDIEALRARVRRQLDDAEARGYARAVAALRDLDRYREWLDTAARENGEPWTRRHSDYLEAVAEQTPGGSE